MKIIYYPDEALTQISTEVSEYIPELKGVLDQMWDKIKDDNNAMALAAPQIGLKSRFFVMKDLQGRRWDIVNPVIQEMDGKDIQKEGCLSFPGIFIWKERPTYVKIEYDLPEGKSVLVAQGLEARCVMHEIEHLDGILLTDHVNRSIRREIDKTMRKFNGRR